MSDVHRGVRARASIQQRHFALWWHLGLRQFGLRQFGLRQFGLRRGLRLGLRLGGGVVAMSFCVAATQIESSV